MMWAKLKFAALLIAFIGTPLLQVCAQQNEPNSTASLRSNEVVQSSAPARLLNLDEGLAVLGAAMETAHHRTIRQDCSHFVHEIYDRAGFPYSYENSVSLYDGTGDFKRVTNAQPGDLIVWRGHMGIIVNPVQHSFFSSLRTGFGVEKYDSRYWRKRGQPRFYRYVKATAASGVTLAAAKTSSAGEVETSEPDEPGIPARPASSVSAAPVGTESRTFESGSPLVVSATRATPEAFRQALEEKFTDTNSNLGNVDLAHATKPVVIVESFQVKKVHVKHDQGWAEVQLNEPSSLTAGEANLQRRSEKQRWPVYRDGKEWHLELPTDSIYVPKDTAVRLLAHQLAAMTGQSNSPNRATPQEAQLARLLDRLLGE